MIKGIGASDGITVSKVFKLVHQELVITEDKITDTDAEIKKLESALAESVKDLEKIKEKTLVQLDQEHAMIFDAHIQIVNDPEMYRQVTELIKDNNTNASYAYKSVAETFASMFEAMDNEYMRERAADIRDVSRRIISYIQGVAINDPSEIDEEVIVVAYDLTPSDTAQLDKNFVKGFVTDIGGRTSHSAIMARSLEIPAVVGTKNITQLTNDGDILLMNGIEGYIIINPSQEEIKQHEEMQKEYQENVKIWNQFKDKESTSKDGHHVELASNIGSPNDLEGVKKYGSEGIGLYRTEFLYMNNDNFPTEDEQFIAYKMVLESMGNAKVVIRTLDIGGDKKLDYFPMDEELNPFLGHRAVRLCLDRKDIFKTQLRALLRASVYGNLHIMFPMIATLGDLRNAKAILEECKEELTKENITFSDEVKVGIMIEIPSAAIIADRFAKEVDFFSIGTNDLIQYSFAADRMNEKVSYLYQPYNPSLLRLIKLVIDAAHKENIWAGMCGEMAGDQLAVPLLLGLGLDEFSMSAPSVLKTRHLLSKLNKKDLEEVAEKALNVDTHNEVKELVEKYLETL